MILLSDPEYGGREKEGFKKQFNMSGSFMCTKKIEKVVDIISVTQCPLKASIFLDRQFKSFKLIDQSKHLIMCTIQEKKHDNIDMISYDVTKKLIQKAVPYVNMSNYCSLDELL